MIRGKITGIGTHELTKTVSISWYAVNPKTEEELIILRDGIAVPPLATDDEIKAAVKARRAIVEREHPITWPDAEMNAALVDAIIE